MTTRTGLHVRCALCHDDAWTEAPTVCGACLAVHHDACFSELGRCAFCAAAFPLRGASDPPTARFAAAALAGPLTLIHLCVGTGLLDHASKSRVGGLEAALSVAGAVLGLVIVVALWGITLSPRVAPWLARVARRTFDRVGRAVLALAAEDAPAPRARAAAKKERA